MEMAMSMGVYHVLPESNTDSDSDSQSESQAAICSVSPQQHGRARLLFISSN